MGSRPALGSSTSRMDGSSAMARARPARLRIPPDRSAGILSNSRSSPTSASLALTRRRISCSGRSRVTPQRKRDVVANRHRIEERRALKEKPHALDGPADKIAARRAPAMSCPSTNTWPSSGFTSPMMCRSVTLLPVPLRPRRQKARDLRNIERDIVEHSCESRRSSTRAPASPRARRPDDRCRRRVGSVGRGSRAIVGAAGSCRRPADRRRK